MHHDEDLLAAAVAVERDEEAVDALLDVGPVPELPQRLEKLGLAILVLQVVRVFPSINNQQGNAALRKIRLVIVDLSDQQLLTKRLPNQSSPSRAHDRRRDFGELLLKVVEAAEISLNGLGQEALRCTATPRRHVAPEDRVKDVS